MSEAMEMQAEEPQRATRKQCSQCRDFKPLEEFFKEKKKTMGLQSRCKFCKSSEQQKRREEKRLAAVPGGNVAETKSQIGESNE